MSKPFKTVEEQMEILKSRGLIIKDEERALSFLKNNNYYELINGYKDFFIDKNKTEEEKKDVYRNDIAFEDIVSLYEFDFETRAIILKGILKIENIIKTKLAYYFSEKYNQEYNYLNIHNYNDKIKSVKIIADISNIIKINMVSSKSEDMRNILEYYLEKHQNVPLWVLIKKFTFGKLSKFYSALIEEIQFKICDDIEEFYLKEYNKSISINNKTLSQMLEFINIVRNICAHNEKLYNIRYKKIKNVSYSHIKRDCQGKLFDVIIILKIFLSKKEFEENVKLLDKNIEKLKQVNSSKMYGNLLNQMGMQFRWYRELGEVMEYKELEKEKILINDKNMERIFIFLEKGSKIDIERTVQEIEEKYLKEPNRQIVIGYDLHSYTTFVVFKRIILDNFSKQDRIKRIEEEKDREYYFEGFDEDFLEILKTEL
jgi:hypothetical protein